LIDVLLALVLFFALRAALEAREVPPWRSALRVDAHLGFD
jgi:hypothetical protein